MQAAAAQPGRAATSAAAVVELIILICLICLIGWEVSRPKDEPPAPAPATPVLEPTPIEPERMPPRLPPPPRPKLVAANVEPPAGGPIPRIMTTALDPAKGQRVELADCYQVYMQACNAESKRAVPPTQFVEPLKRLCREIDIRTKVQGTHFYLIDVRLAASRADAAV